MSQSLKQQALEAVCSCYYYDLANCVDDMDASELQQIITDPYHCHRINGDDLSECSMYQTEQAEQQRDADREDGKL